MASVQLSSFVELEPLYRTKDKKVSRTKTLPKIHPLSGSPTFKRFYPSNINSWGNKPFSSSSMTLTWKRQRLQRWRRMRRFPDRDLSDSSLATVSWESKAESEKRRGKSESLSQQVFAKLVELYTGECSSCNQRKVKFNLSASRVRVIHDAQQRRGGGLSEWRRGRSASLCERKIQLTALGEPARVGLFTAAACCRTCC